MRASRDSVVSGWEAQKSRAFARRDRVKGAGLSVAGALISGADCANVFSAPVTKQPPGGHSQVSFGDGLSNAGIGQSDNGRHGKPTGRPPPVPFAQNDNLGQRSVQHSTAAHGANEGVAPQSYGDMLAMQIEQKKSLKNAERKRQLLDDRADDDRVQREAGELRSQVDVEIAKQRQREATCVARQDALTKFIEQQNSTGVAASCQSSGLEPQIARQPSAPQLHQVNSPYATSTNQPHQPNIWVSHARPYASEDDQFTKAEIPRRSHSHQPPFASHDEKPGEVGMPSRSSLHPRQCTLHENQPHARCPSTLPGASEAQRGVSSNQWAQGANQNCGNMISDRPTSRVLQPPGGGSSFKLGNW